jgi:hypothetical protein
MVTMADWLLDCPVEPTEFAEPVPDALEPLEFETVFAGCWELFVAPVGVLGFFEGADLGGVESLKIEDIGPVMPAWTALATVVTTGMFVCGDASAVTVLATSKAITLITIILMVGRLAFCRNPPQAFMSNILKSRFTDYLSGS